ncbi:glycosyltransferase family 57 protein [Xylona heveae TC161]|uniref:Alpha-1,3-glucosyltransferase n=1 Tax=Xylona heveae (strain CBS 132557 / TC161) TaxID=1328760 RepID=A0A165HMC2_XYLHT|nr:glycosyltransferase family 57 protein [Xylona heveae TC161]KZF23729.1 glycosyltransferase family 57 protein [Xylona heveae TC161]
MPPKTPASTHRPRRRNKISTGLPSTPGHGTSIFDPLTQSQRPAFPLAAFLWPARGTTSQWVLLPVLLMVVGLFRWAIGLWGYSGFNSPPMHGDFEAQRHWMEITNHLPVSKWYFYDLQWWGLDYPPLTAYHSWLLGKIGSKVNPAWFALDTSRRMDDPMLKIYMRATVIISEYLIYIPAIIVFFRHFRRREAVDTWESSIALLAFLMQPATILTDHGHFQYNTVMLGFFLAALSNILAGRLLWSCIFFVAALGFKQMALYYAPPIFAYLLGVSVIPRLHLSRFLGIAIITILSFVLLLAPFIIGVAYDVHRQIPMDETEPPLLSIIPFRLDRQAFYYPFVLQLGQMVHRVFPFARGIFEDKVANIWCALHTFHKLHKYPQIWLQRISLLATLAAIAPSCLVIFLKPRRDLLPLTLASSAWGFFLCSFQVHEKSVLLPLLPMTLLLGSDSGLGPSKRSWIGFANILGAWTLFPLLKRDELRFPYFIFTLLWAYLLDIPPASLGVYTSYHSQPETAVGLPTKFLHISFYCTMVVWHFFEFYVAPPQRKPDLWVVANAGIGAAGFGICYLWCTWHLLLQSKLFSDASPQPAAVTPLKQRLRSNGRAKQL